MRLDVRAYEPSLVEEMEGCLQSCQAEEILWMEVVSLPSHIIPSLIFEDESIVIEFNHAHQVTL